MKIPRLVTTGRIHRAFPILDHFDDEQCEHMIRAERGRVGFMVLTAFVVLAAIALTFAATLTIGLPVYAWAELRIIRGLGLGQGPGGLVALAAATFTLFSSCGVAGLIARDLMLWFQLRVAIGRRLRTMCCLSCGYELIGQRARAGEVTCPECGLQMTLEQLNLGSPRDLLPRCK